MNTVSSSGTEARSVKSRSVPAKRIVAGVIAAGAIVTGIGAGIASAAPPPQGNHYQQPNRWQPQPRPNRWQPQPQQWHPRPQWHPQPRWQPGQYTPNGFWLFGFWIPLP
ncbi:hypothetical protein [Gordonia polyisoprenivorans]|uniref:hypothetical protein n=1 Tax=Gordonia polyisoprenivorans TaxID=84595 RepID=UPI001AD72933|nr:hypothetical protein [Gordonia polyisoprenivorans]QTI68204.1 hypothetical protein J6U32_22290 [Gordonia polyisoprenivorans]